jgi:hypothetical protein
MFPEAEAAVGLGQAPPQQQAAQLATLVLSPAAEHPQQQALVEALPAMPLAEVLAHLWARAVSAVL